ncbi:MAG: PD-(D/E)XK nuclease family protein, partial [Oscillospiraceae bacterium]
QGADAENINLKKPLINPPARPDGFNQRFLDTKADKAAPLVFFEEKLYSYTSEVRENENGCIRLVCADNARAECEMAAAHCLKLARETGCRWHDFAIAVRGFDEYAPILTEVFARYGVPLFTARQESILQKPAPALISSAFEIIFGGWDTDAVLGYLKTGLLPLSQEESDLLEGYILMWHPRSSMWSKKGAWTQHPQGFGKEFDDESTALLGKIDELRRRLAAPLLALFSAGKRAQTAAEQATALADFLVAINLPQTLSERAVELENAGRELLAAEYVQLWEIILKSLEQFAAILGEAPMTQELFSKLYLQTLSQYEVSVIPVSADSVSAGDMDRMRRRHIKHLIVLGAGDDRLPRIQDAGGIFSSDERDTLSEIGLPLGGGTDDLSRELSLIYNCVTLPSQTLTLSYCTFDSSGAEVRPSFLINRARLLFNLEAERFDPQAARLSAPRPAFMLAANAFSGGEKNARLAFEYFSETEEGREKLFSLRDRAEIKRGELSKPAVRALYGDTLRLSPSRADSFSSCHFSYFLRYGLKLNEREQAGFEAPELGSFMHYVLENVAGEISAGAGFKAASTEISNALTDKYTERYIAEVLHGFEDKSPRFVYLFNRLRPSVRNIVADMVSELAVSDFAPLDFELSFMRDGDLPPVRLSDGENEILLNGIADRVDGCMKDGKLYLRVIDYKTGKKSFSLSDIWYGMGMQMLLYLFALEREGSARYNCEIVPAGVLYVPARDTLISAPGDLSDEELAAEKAKLHRRSGLLLNNSDIITAMEHGDAPEYIPVKYKKDGSANEDSLASAEQLKLLSEHLDRRLLELAEKLSGGCIDATPIYRGEQENACLFCPYVSVCRFDDTRDKRCYLSKIKPAEFWSRLEDEK